MLVPPIDVLVVDDDALLREVLVARLRHEGYRVTGAENGQLALDAMATTPPGILITDWQMPEMDGLQLCSAVREKAEFDGMPIYMFSASPAEDGDVALAGIADARYIQKRNGLNGLVAALKGGVHATIRGAAVPAPYRQGSALALGAARS